MKVRPFRERPNSLADLSTLPPCQALVLAYHRSWPDTHPIGGVPEHWRAPFGPASEGPMPRRLGHERSTF